MADVPERDIKCVMYVVSCIFLVPHNMSVQVLLIGLCEWYMKQNVLEKFSNILRTNLKQVIGGPAGVSPSTAEALTMMCEAKDVTSVMREYAAQMLVSIHDNVKVRGAEPLLDP